jgi:regulator of replication initiation timing
LARAKDPSTASNKLDKQIQTTQKELSEINKNRLPLLKENNKLTGDICPIKYVADMFFGNGEDAVE